MLIRRAVRADAEAIATVHVRSWQVGYRGQLPDGPLDALDPADRVPWWRERLDATSWPTRGTLLAEDGAARVLGFAGIYPTRDDDQDPEVVGEVAAFYVEPAAWRTGVGRLLMAATLEALAGPFRRATLWVLDTNARAIGFYEATGWRADGATQDDVILGTEIREARYVRDLPG